MMVSTIQKKTLQSILAGKISKLSIQPPAPTSAEDFDFSEVFGPLTSHPSSSSSLLQDPEIIHTRSHSLIGPSPRFTPATSLLFDDALQSSDEDDGEADVIADAEIAKNEGEKGGKKMGPGDFEILRVVGQGAFGKVFQVRKKGVDECFDGGQDDGIFAMKVMRKDTIIKKNHVDYMKAERDILTKVVHPFIVQLQCSFQVSETTSPAAMGVRLLTSYPPQTPL